MLSPEPVYLLWIRRSPRGTTRLASWAREHLGASADADKNHSKTARLQTIHFLKIDVEGAEAEVLEGLNLERIRPWIIVIEANEPNSTRSTRSRVGTSRDRTAVMALPTSTVSIAFT